MTTEIQTASPARPGKYLSFMLGHQEYGLAIPRVQEIIGSGEITRVPHLPAHVRGVVNLRGRTIPVVDLRARFALPACDDAEKSCVIVVQVARDEQTLLMGMIVDEVAEVLSLTREQIEPVLAPGGDTDAAACIAGKGQLGKKVLMLLDIDRVLNDEEVLL